MAAVYSSKINGSAQSEMLCTWHEALRFTRSRRNYAAQGGKVITEQGPKGVSITLNGLPPRQHFDGDERKTVEGLRHSTERRPTSNNPNNYGGAETH